MKKTTVYLTDDHVALRAALAKEIDSWEHFAVAGEASDGQEAMAAFEGGMQTDMILLDLNMKTTDGYAVAEWLRQHHPAVKILIMTMGVEQHRLSALLEAGVKGILNKDATPAELLKALETVAGGQQYFSNEVIQNIAGMHRKASDVAAKAAVWQVKEKELEFIRLVATDLTYKEIYSRLGLTKNAGENLRVNLFEKLDVKSRTALAMFGVKHGFADL